MAKSETAGISELYEAHLAPLVARHAGVPTAGPGLAEFKAALRKVIGGTKLVIWDLDDTFWRGTLAEETMSYRPEHHALVEGLSRRGIINSVCSNNEHERAWAPLSKSGIAEHFVFPMIAWTPKGPLVKSIIEAAQLQPRHVLFLDDNERIRNEVMHYNPGVLAADVSLLAPLSFEEWPESDPGLRRLAEYKLLERRDQAKRKAESENVSNHDFLQRSKITVQIVDAKEQVERALELVNRTNQLNYTKKRLTQEQLDALLSSSRHECRCIRVQDVFGDYGWVGFYALDKETRALEHFLFSCRIINMGIEHHIYQRLGRPRLEVVGDVATPITAEVPDWLTEVDGATSTPAAAPKAEGAGRLRVFLKGGCDLEIIQHLVTNAFGMVEPEDGSAGPPRQLEVETELHYVPQSGVANRWPEHTELLRLAFDPERRRQAQLVLDRIPWIDEQNFSTRIASPEFDVVVYSALMDMGAGVYKHKRLDLSIPAIYFERDLTDPTQHEKLSQTFKIPREALALFAEEFVAQGPIAPQRFYENLEWLHQKLGGRLLVLINGADVDFVGNYPFGPGHTPRHRQMNAVIDDFVGSHKNVALCDVRRFVTSAEEIDQMLHHYQRMIYWSLSQAIADSLHAVPRR